MVVTFSWRRRAERCGGEQEAARRLEEVQDPEDDDDADPEHRVERVPAREAVAAGVRDRLREGGAGPGDEHLEHDAEHAAGYGAARARWRK